MPTAHHDTDPLSFVVPETGALAWCGEWRVRDETFWQFLNSTFNVLERDKPIGKEKQKGDK